MVEVTQADRDAALDLDERHIIQVWNINETAKAFAEHRMRAVEAQAAEIERLREAMANAIGEIETGAPFTGCDILRAALEETLHVAETCKENGETFT